MEANTPRRQLSHKSNKYMLIILSTIAAVVLIAAIVAVVYLVTSPRPMKDRYQVVYTTNGQAYFGKLRNPSGSYLYLDSVYTAQDLKTEKDSSTNTKTTLLKISDQVYGPEDTIAIRADNVLFWQDLKTDSKVAKAIEDAN